MTKAFVMITADRVDHGELRLVSGALQQETRLYEGDRCVCALLVTYPTGSPVWEQWVTSRRLDGLPAVRTDSIHSDAGLEVERT